MTVVECTSGGTGTSLAFVCKQKDYPFKVVSSDAFAAEKLQAMRFFGAEVDLMPSEGGKITPDLIPRMIEKVRAMSRRGGCYWTRQFENEDALEGYCRMGKEIIRQMDRPIDIFCAAVGTAGMLTGVAKEIKREQPSARIVVLEPSSAPLISQGIKGSHQIDGVAVGFLPPLLAQAGYDEVLTVDEPDARQMARRLAKEEGIFAGTSTGLNVCAALKLAERIGPRKAVLTVACDSGLKYVSSGLFQG
jgi:cysteine synthase A